MLKKTDYFRSISTAWIFLIRVEMDSTFYHQEKHKESRNLLKNVVIPTSTKSVFRKSLAKQFLEVALKKDGFFFKLLHYQH